MALVVNMETVVSGVVLEASDKSCKVDYGPALSFRRLDFPAPRLEPREWTAAMRVVDRIGDLEGTTT